MRRRWNLGARMVVALVAGMLLTSAGVAAQDDLASSGNGGTGTGAANGGAAAIGDVMSGGNAGNAVLTGDTGGGEISGGAVANSTDGAIDVDGGTGIAAADGGEDNIAFTYEPAPNRNTGDDNDNGDGNNNDPFQVCIRVDDSPFVCGGGSCGETDLGLACFADQATCDELQVPFNPCVVGGEAPGECVQPNPNRANCLLFS